MNIVNRGAKETPKKRTSIKAGDSVIVYLSSKGGILFSVFRSDAQPLRFEGGDDKCLLMNFPPNSTGAFDLISLICQITGLQAKLRHEQEEYMSFEMREGKSIFAD